MSYDPPYGYALRATGTCPSDTAKCKTTWSDVVACCPSNSSCAGLDENGNPICCPTKASCMNPIYQSPHCASSRWTMYNHQGFFCCDTGQIGFWTSQEQSNNSVACAAEPKGASRTILNAAPQTLASTTFVSSTASSTSTTTSSPSPGSDNHVGAIAGGVVGGVAGVAFILALTWFCLWRRRRKSYTAPEPASEDLTYPYMYSKPATEPPSELPSDPGGHSVYELPVENR
ncbi:hypothetical protein BDV25DRAFT_139631 [Aspergillus avenaceus]|uniref:Mid2 domain-containing protein n=1 Tax=Aspergillus avenaceus TaxID=36643 RepID=A0A5N6TX27_ASPAV|nr:hypothetical protein BDV25DRAFT_139631 [Aspergillus avenaceus]